MAIRPIFDDMGNVLSWEDTTPTDAATAAAPTPAATAAAPAPTPIPRDFTPSTPGATPPPNIFGTPPSTPPDMGPDAPGPGVTAKPSAATPIDGGTTLIDTGGTPSSPFSASAPEFTWPEFNAPSFDPGPAFEAPPAFSYEAFKAPTLDDAKAEPGYEFARSEGLRGLENVAASRGVARTGGTLKDLIGWGNRFAEQNYGNVFNRAGQTYDRNYTNAADTYKTNYGVSKDVFDTNYGQRKDKFAFDYQGAKDMFAPKERAASATFDDLYRRWKAELDANTSLATAGTGL